MGFRQTVIVSLLFLLATGILSAQPNKNGVPIVTNYEHSVTKGSEQNWCITQDHRGVIYVGNNNKGVLEYDGVEWRRIPVPRDPMVCSVITGQDGVVYVGASSAFGYLLPDRYGKMIFRSLSDTIDQKKLPFGEVWKIYYLEGKVYFCSFNYIFIYDHLKETLTHIETPEYTYFSFLIDGNIYLSAWEQGLMRYQNDQFVVVPGGEFFINKSITGLVKFDNTRVLAGTFSNGIYLFDTQSGFLDEGFMDQELTEYLKQGTITNIQAMEEDFAVARLNHGVVILSRDGKATEIVTKKEELIDEDATFAYYNERLEKTSPLWITFVWCHVGIFIY